MSSKAAMKDLGIKDNDMKKVTAAEFIEIVKGEKRRAV